MIPMRRCYANFFFFIISCSEILSDLHVAHVYHWSHLNWIPRSFFLINIGTSCMCILIRTPQRQQSSNKNRQTQEKNNTEKRTSEQTKQTHEQKISTLLFAMMHAFGYEDTMIDMWHPRLQILRRHTISITCACHVNAFKVVIVCSVCVCLVLFCSISRLKKKNLFCCYCNYNAAQYIVQVH